MDPNPVPRARADSPGIEALWGVPMDEEDGFQLLDQPPPQQPDRPIRPLGRPARLAQRRREPNPNPVPIPLPPPPPAVAVAAENPFLAAIANERERVAFAGRNGGPVAAPGPDLQPARIPQPYDPDPVIGAVLRAQQLRQARPGGARVGFAVPPPVEMEEDDLFDHADDDEDEGEEDEMAEDDQSVDEKPRPARTAFEEEDAELRKLYPEIYAVVEPPRPVGPVPIDGPRASIFQGRLAVGDEGDDWEVEAGPARLNGGQAVNGNGRQQAVGGGSEETPITAKDAATIIPTILALIPDACDKFVLNLLQTRVLHSKPKTPHDAVSEAVEMIFESNYPKAEKVDKGKRRARSDSLEVLSKPAAKRRSSGPGDSSGPADDVDDNLDENGRIKYTSLHSGLYKRMGAEYTKKSIRELENCFDRVQVNFIKTNYGKRNNLFAPTFLFLMNEMCLAEDKRSFREMKDPRPAKPEPARKKGKGKSRSKAAAIEVDDDGNVIPDENDGGEKAFLDEKDWLLNHLREECGNPKAVEFIKLMVPPTDVAQHDCGCCFDEEHMQFMVQCEDGHLFCRQCLSSMMNNAIGEQKAPITCMDGSGCKARFLERELKKAITKKTLVTYHNLLQRKELEAAGIENLESCPACEYAVVMENEYEKLFVCAKDDCGMISCRKCKKPDHIPKTCEEASKDNTLDKRHTIEEAMTSALVRNCPNGACNKPFLKESGCNKITCMNCGKISCYVCRKLITDGYNHFDQSPADYAQPKKSGKCRLWDPKDKDIYQEDVAEARRLAQEKALKEAEEAGIEVKPEDLNVALDEVRRNPDRPGPVGAAYEFLAGRGYPAAPNAVPVAGPLALHLPPGNAANFAAPGAGNAFFGFNPAQPAQPPAPLIAIPRPAPAPVNLEAAELLNRLRARLAGVGAGNERVRIYDALNRLQAQMNIVGGVGQAAQLEARLREARMLLGEAVRAQPIPAARGRKRNAA